MADPARVAEALQGRYRIERELGQGGMATVYLAHDLRHERKVAIKVLRPELAAVIGADRFVREIRTVAGLQHPHILGLIDSGEVQGTAYYVMPFVEGESLRDRLSREKQLPIADAVRIACEVASALDYAHRHGVIHRDIKPENILLHDGQALVADFGIALAVSQAGGSRMTETGMSLGTPHYMSPEQAMGEREITARSDVYALGAVTYEMLTGDPPFTGSTAQAIVAKVLTEKPPGIRRQRDRVAPAIEEAVLTALEKLPADRYGSAADFAAALRGEAALGRHESTRIRLAPSAPRRVTLTTLVAVAAFVILATATALSAWFQFRAEPPAAITRLAIGFPSGEERQLTGINVDLALSPDGRSFVYGSGTGALLLRRFDKLHATPVPGTDDGYNPFFSADGGSVVFTTGGGEMRIVALASGLSRTLVPDSAGVWGGAWGDDGFIYYTSAARDLRRIRAGGGPVEIVVRLAAARGEHFLYRPEPFPGGGGVLYAIAGPLGVEIKAKRFTTGQVASLGPGIAARFLTSDYLAIAQRDGTVKVARFNREKLAFAGAAVPMLERIRVLPFNNGPVISISRTGTILYAEFGSGQKGTPTWVNRVGVATDVEAGWSGGYDNPALSPDGTRIALAMQSTSGSDIWIKRIGGPLSRLTLRGAGSLRPTWSADGRSVLFALEDGGLMLQPADGSAPARPVLISSRFLLEGLISRDGAWLVYRTGGGGGDSRDIYARRLKGDSTPLPLLTAMADEYSAALSPDNRWLAYVSDESGTAEVYVRPFPEVDQAKWQLSSGGGSEPGWAHSGRELFFRDHAGHMVAVSVEAGHTFSTGTPRVLFDASPYRSEGIHTDYAVSPDDRRFLMIRQDAAASSSVVVVFNLLEDVRQRLGR